MSLQILGTGSALPELIKNNDALAGFLDTSDEWIVARTGIHQRHWLNGETVDELAVQAGRRALEDAGVQPEELDYILCATLGGEYITPPLACMVQKALGAHCPAVDLNAACSGFMYALDMAAACLARGAKKVLVLGAEGLTRFADWTDRSTCVLFGDGAGAVVVAPGENMPYMKLVSDGQVDMLNIPAASGNMPLDQTPLRKPRQPSYVNMDGGEVYKFAVRAVADGIRDALKAMNLAPEEVDHVLLHQANLRIIEAAKKKLPIPHDRYHVNIDRMGNMSAASVPVLLDECNRAGSFRPGDILILNAFGGGLTIGTAVLRWGRA